MDGFNWGDAGFEGGARAREGTVRVNSECDGRGEPDKRRYRAQEKESSDSIWEGDGEEEEEEIRQPQPVNCESTQPERSGGMCCVSSCRALRR